MRQFYTVWFGQLISTLGTHLSGFSLGIWVYQKNESATQFAMIWVLTLLPSLLLAPIAGPLIDRWNRRLVMLASDSGAALMSLTLLYLVWGGELEIGHVYLVTGLSSMLQAFQGPAFLAAISQMVPVEQLGRANGLLQIQEALGSLLAPASAGLLLGVFGLQGVLALDLASFCFAAGTLIMIRIPGPSQESDQCPGAKGNLLLELKDAVDFLLDRRALLFLLLSITISNFLTGMVTVLITPYLLVMTSVQVMGLLSTVMGVGMLLGSGWMTWRGKDCGNLINLIFGCLLLSACALVGVGLTDSIGIIALWGFSFFSAQPVIAAASNTLWQLHVPHHLQGRVFSLRRMIAWSGLPIAYLAAGPLADRIFEPMMAEHGEWTPWFGWLVGTGEGRGMALIFVGMGVLAFLAAFVLPLSTARHLGKKVE